MQNDNELRQAAIKELARRELARRESSAGGAQPTADAQQPKEKSWLQSALFPTTPNILLADVAKDKFQSYLQNAQPAFKLAVTHPETIMGQPAMGKGGKPLTPDELEAQTNLEWADIYRQANLPFSKSTSLAGQLVPQAAGMLLDFGTRPSSYAAAGMLPEAGNLLATTPPTRRFLQTQLPTLSKKLLADNPMQPIYKSVHGMMVDITKPLPAKPAAIAQRGIDVYNSIDKTMSNVGTKFSSVVGKNRLTYDDVTKAITPEVEEAFGIKAGAIRDTAELWEARNTIRKAVADPWMKQALGKRTTLKEDDVMAVMAHIKAIVMDRMTPAQRATLEVLDSQYGKMLGAGNSIKQLIYNPKKNVVHIEALKKALQNPESDASQLFKNFDYFDKMVGKFATDIRKAVIHQKRVQTMKNAVKWIGIGAAGLTGVGLTTKGIISSMQDALGVDSGSDNSSGGG